MGNRALAFIALLTCTLPAAAMDRGEPTATRWVAAINKADVDALAGLIDPHDLAVRVLGALAQDAKDREFYLKTLSAQFASHGQRYGLQLKGQRATAAVVRTSAAHPGVPDLVRITTRDRRGNHAHTYLWLELNADGEIVDWYDHAYGQKLSAQLVLQALSVLSAVEAARLYFGEAAATAEVASILSDVAIRIAGSDPRAAHAELMKMPDSLHAHRAYATLRLALARHVDPEAYREALSALARHHGDADDLQFILIDHYLLGLEFTAALRTIDRAAQVLGNDEVMEANRCVALTEMKRKADAVAACDRAIALAPRFETPRWTRVRIGLLTEDAALALVSLTGVEVALGQPLDADELASLPYYAWLVQQPEWEPWAAERRGKSAAATVDGGR